MYNFDKILKISLATMTLTIRPTTVKNKASDVLTKVCNASQTPPESFYNQINAYV